jgi:hypothetical protein
MARMINGKISGSISNTTYYTVNGISILRSKPGRGGVKQSKATKKSASAFGKASSIIHPLLNELATELNFKMIMKNRGKVVSAAKNWLMLETEEADSSLNTFQPALELNDIVTLEKILNVQMELIVAKDNTLSVVVGSFNPFADIKAPQKTEIVELKVVLVTSNTTKEQTIVEKYPISVEIPFCDAEVGEQTLEFPIHPGAGSIILVGLIICYKGYQINGMDRDRKWLPAGVLGLGRIR